MCLLMKLLKCVESTLCVSSGLGKNMSLLSTIFSISIYANSIVVTYVTLFIYWQTEIKCPLVAKLAFNAVIYFIVTEMNKDTVNSNAMYMVDMDNLYTSRNDMLILLSIF